MAFDWAARLDERGYHLTPTTRPDTAWRWDGPVEVAEDGYTDGAAIVIWHEAVEVKVEVGGVYYLTGTRKGRPAEIALITDICEKPRMNTVWLGVKFFYRPEHSKLSDDFEWHPRELFLFTERHKREMWSGTLELVPITVTELHDVSAFQQPPPPHTFFYRREFDGKDYYDVKPPEGATGAGVSVGAAGTDTDAGAEAVPMDAEPMEVEPTPAPERPKRRNRNEERLAALEAQVASLEVKANVTDALVSELADVKASLERAQVQLDEVASTSHLHLISISSPSRLPLLANEGRRNLP